MPPSHDIAEVNDVRTGLSGGFSVLDGGALVVGSTLASIHLRHLVEERSLSAFGWGLVWVTFTGIALTATGPFLLLVRRYLRRIPGYPRVGDWLWALLGAPWLISAMLRGTYAAQRGGGLVSPLDSRVEGIYMLALWSSQALACLIVLIVVWKTWVLASPAELKARDPVLWTDRVGLALAVAWPLQCGFSLVAVG